MSMKGTISMQMCKQCNTPMEERYVVKVTSYGILHIGRGKTGFPSDLGTKGGEISLYHEIRPDF